MPFKGDSDEFQPLFGLKIDGTTNSSSTSLTSGRYSIKTLLSNFNSASLAFSISTGCATCCLSYASALLGNSLGATSSGLLFALYAISSFIFSKPIVTMIGPKNGLILGVLGQTIYICGFFLSVVLNSLTPTFSSMICIIASCFGGMAGGVLWTSQGIYLSTHTQLFAKETSQELEKVTADFSALFAVVLLVAEMIAKVLSSLLFHIFGDWGTYAIIPSVFLLASFLSCFIMLNIESLDIEGTWDFSYATVSRDAGAVARLVWTDTRLIMTLPFQLVYGYTAGFVPYYLFGTVVSESPELGIGSVGFFSAIVVLIGAVLAIPTAHIANIYGKDRVITIAAMCISTAAWPLLFFTNEFLGQTSVILFMVIFYGAGRGMWEVINKAVIVDFYGNDNDKVGAAFSAASFANGYASGMGFLMFPYLSRIQMAGLCLGGCFFSLITYVYSFELQKHRLGIIAANAESEIKLDEIREQGRQSRLMKCKNIQKGDSSSIAEVHSTKNNERNIHSTVQQLAFGSGLSLINSSNNHSSIQSFTSQIGGSRRKKKSVETEQSETDTV